MKSWYAAKSSGNQGVVVEDGTGKTIAVVYNMKDVLLLAAAPEMYSVLKEVLKEMETRGRPHLNPSLYRHVLGAINSVKYDDAGVMG